MPWRFVLVAGCLAFPLASSLKPQASPPEAGKRFVLVIQYPFDQKIKLPLFRTGALEKVDGEATVRRKKSTVVEVELADAPQPSSVKPEYQAYVLWAVEANGNLVNLGAFEKNRAEVTTRLQAFGLVVSLEPDPRAAKPKGLFVLESHLPAKRTRFFGMQKVFYAGAGDRDAK